MKNTTKETLSTALRLLIICAIVALIISLVYGITKNKIALNEREETAIALNAIYSDDFNGRTFNVAGEEFVIKDGDSIIAKCSEVDMKTFIRKDITALYVLNDVNSNAIGYCVAIEPIGFKDAIKMLVAVNTDLSVKGVKIISMSETAGIGTKAQDESFLSQFTKMPAGDVEVISGATKTTKPIIDAVISSVEQVTVYCNTIGGVINE